MKPFVVYNPAAGGGRTARDWGRIAGLLGQAIGPFDHAATSGIGHAPVLVGNALAGGPRLVVAIGGDGTASEAIDGMFRDGRPAAPGASIGIVATGTGGDFRRSFGWSGGVESDIARLATGASRIIDIGRISYTGHDGTARARHFHNIASIGVSAAVANAAARATHARMLGSKGLFLYKTVTTLLTYRFAPVRVAVDNHFDETLPVALLAVANGAFFGGGMKVAPEADPADGMFEVVMVRGESKPRLIGSLTRIYDGSHVTHAAVRILRGQRVTATAVETHTGQPVLIEVDGEAPGRLPARFEIVPGALILRG